MDPRSPLPPARGRGRGETGAKAMVAVAASAPTGGSTRAAQEATRGAMGFLPIPVETCAVVPYLSYVPPLPIVLL
jgi:hypothetical protein